MKKIDENIVATLNSLDDENIFKLLNKFYYTRLISEMFKYIKQPSERLQLRVVKKRGRAIRNIQNPSEKVQLAAVKTNYDCIEFIKNPSEKVQLIAIKKNYKSFYLIKNPTEKAKKLFHKLHSLYYVQCNSLITLNGMLQYNNKYVR